jgi:hypothetical protein
MPPCIYRALGATARIRHFRLLRHPDRNPDAHDAGMPAQQGTLTCSAVQGAPVRYRIEQIVEGEYEKQLLVRADALGRGPASSVSIQVHLRDGWMDTPAEIGDIVHVLADVNGAEGAQAEPLHASCDCSSGKGSTHCAPAPCLQTLVTSCLSWHQRVQLGSVMSC